MKPSPISPKRLCLPILLGILLLTSISWAGPSAPQIPFEEDDGNILIQARVNHSAPLWFLLDTGTDAIIDIQQARALGLKSDNRQEVLGLGGSAGGAVLQGLTLHLPGMDLRDRSAVALPLGEVSSSLGRPVAGILGYELFQNLIVAIDYENKRIDLYAPSDGPRDAGEGLPMEFHQTYVPVISAKVLVPGRKPIEGRFVVDTGFNGSVALMKPFIESNAVMKSVGPTHKAHGEGIQEVRTSLGRIAGLQIGRSVFQNPVTSFSLTDESAVSGIAGLIGGKLLRRYQVVFDYPHQRLFLKPNKYFSEPDEFDMSGMALKAEGADLRTIRVLRILDHSPAAEAGVHAADILSTIDGKPAKDLPLNEILRMFQQEGRDYVLEIKRGKQRMKLTMKLRRLI